MSALASTASMACKFLPSQYQARGCHTRNTSTKVMKVYEDQEKVARLMMWWFTVSADLVICLMRQVIFGKSSNNRCFDLGA